MERNVWSIFDTPKIAQSTLLFFAFEDLLYTSLHLTNPPSLSLVLPYIEKDLKDEHSANSTCTAIVSTHRPTTSPKKI